MLDDAKTLSEKLSSLYYEIVGELKSAVDEKAFRIVVFIDDLDRCLPEKAVELLEAIKLFLDIEGYLFVIGVDREVIKKGISYRYRFFEHKEEKENDTTAFLKALISACRLFAALYCYFYTITLQCNCYSILITLESVWN